MGIVNKSEVNINDERESNVIKFVTDKTTFSWMYLKQKKSRRSKRVYSDCEKKC